MSRAEFHERIEAQKLAPLWEVLSRLLSRTPVTQAVPHLWRENRAPK